MAKDKLLFWKFLIAVSVVLSVYNLSLLSGLYSYFNKQFLLNNSPETAGPNFSRFSTTTGYIILTQAPLVVGVIVALVLGAAFYLGRKN